MKQDHIFHYRGEFKPESGGSLSEFQLQYTTLGQLNKDRSNVVWVIHALTGNSDVTSWWPGLFEKNSPYDPKEHFIICVNTLGGCYGSTGPLSVNPKSGKPYFHEFPLLTNRDVVRAFDLLRIELGLNKVNTVIGSSLGGQQALEWSIQRPEVFEHLVLIACNAYHSPWGIAFNEAQRLAIAADETWKENDRRAGLKGMIAARAIAMLSYRSFNGFTERQSEKDSEKTDDYRASSYLKYQGEKLAGRFNAFTYWVLSKAMDNHHVGRSRESIESALNGIKARTLVISIESDILFQPSEQKFLADHIPQAKLEVIHSLYGHDGFLVEFDQLKKLLYTFYQTSPSTILL
ncbi:MAG TPA: homoserine O-acetyltransferase [Cyclobacteriaceae bacterium]|nr:homoserine O-acetyltransferase [Cyclobacteriaceae bacterium]